MRFDFEINIVSYERPEMTQALINQFRKDLPFEAFIRVWENSPVQYQYYGINELRWNRFNPSLTRVWNWAIAQSSHEWVLVASDDIKLKEGWYGRISQEREAYPGVLWHGASRCFFINKKLIERIGWFDENMTSFCYEDLDYIRRINQADAPHLYGPVSVFEQDAVTLKPQTNRFMFEGTNHEYFKTKYNDHNPEWFKGTPLFKTLNAYPFADCSPIAERKSVTDVMR